jgi:hypothetical protein
MTSTVEASGKATSVFDRFHIRALSIEIIVFLIGDSLCLNSTRNALEFQSLNIQRGATTGVDA